MTRITVTETIGIEIPISQGNSNRNRRWDNNSRGQGHSDRGRGRRWNPNQQYHDPGVSTGIPISKSKSLPTTPHGTAIQVPNPIWSVSISVSTTTIPVTNANPLSTSR